MPNSQGSQRRKPGRHAPRRAQHPQTRADENPHQAKACQSRNQSSLPRRAPEMLTIHDPALFAPPVGVDAYGESLLHLPEPARIINSRDAPRRPCRRDRFGAGENEGDTLPGETRPSRKRAVPEGPHRTTIKNSSKSSLRDGRNHVTKRPLAVLSRSGNHLRAVTDNPHLDCCAMG